jgi:cytoskeletal protein RodZ
MSSFGENLRQEREARHISLEEISAATKISVRLLQAIEEEEFDRLPGGVFNTNFIRQYARHMGLDEEKVLGEYRALTAPPAEIPTLHRISGPQPEWRFTAPAERDTVPRQDSQLWKWTTLGMALLGVCSALYLWVQDRQTDAAINTPPAKSERAPRPTPPNPVAEARPPTKQTPEASAAPAGPASAPAASLLPPSGDAAVRVDLRASEDVWVSAVADGESRFQAVLQPEQTRSILAKSIVRLRVGNAGALAITLNGAPQAPLGPKGHVRTVVLTPSGMEVVAPVPPPESSAEPER